MYFNKKKINLWKKVEKTDQKHVNLTQIICIDRIENSGMNPRYTLQEINQMLQHDAEEVMNCKCHKHDFYTEHGLYDCIKDCFMSDMDEDDQKDMYSAIVPYMNSKRLTEIHKKFGKGRRTMYDTLVAALFIQAEILRFKCVYHRNNNFLDCNCRGCQDSLKQPPNA